MAEKVIPHEAMVTLRMLFRQVDVLVHVERYDITEGNLTGFVQRDEGFVHTQRRRTGR